MRTAVPVLEPGVTAQLAFGFADQGGILGNDTVDRIDAHRAADEQAMA